MAEEEQVDQEDKDDQTLDSFASKILRRNKAGAYENTLCLHLVKATTAPPMEKIRLICEAAWMVPDTPVSKENLDVFYTITNTLNQSRKDMVDPYERWHGQILWGIEQNEENFRKYIAPWLRTWSALFYRPFEYLEKEEKERFSKLDGAEYFWALTKRSHVTTIASLENRFINWAMPGAMQMFEQLSRLVSPDTYMDMLDKVRS